jgi:hypothetical protein
MCKHQGERCVFSSDCKTPCTKAGNCTKGNVPNNESRNANEPRCIASGEESCRKSEACQLYGLCGYDARNNRCIVSTCSGTPCGTYGRCTIINDQGIQRCGPALTRDCEQSALCSSQGLCKQQNGTCVASDTGCANSDLCKNSGRCHADAITGKCTAKKDSDCTDNPPNSNAQGNISVCFLYGLCKVAYIPADRIFACVAETTTNCTDSQGCKNNAKCTLRERACVKDADCSYLCKKYGKCEKSSATDFTCTTTKVEHCQQSELGLLFGQCRYEDDACVAARDDCPKSAICLRFGKCDYDSAKKSCVFNDTCQGATGCDSCKQSIACKVSGLCEQNTDPLTLGTQPCIAEEFFDPKDPSKKVGDSCSDSTDCKEKGLCAYTASGAGLGPSCIFSNCSGPPCDTFGRCTTQTTTYLGQTMSICVSTSQDDCQNSSNCSEKGNWPRPQKPRPRQRTQLRDLCRCQIHHRQYPGL